MPILIYICVFIVGTVFGSFLNTIIYRLYKKEDFVRGRSNCPYCGHALNWDDLIPIVSFFVLGGKCRYCHQKISWQYPLVEFATGLLFLGAFYQNADLIFDLLGFGIFKLFYLFFVICCLVVIFVYDYKHYLIPNKIIYPLIGGVFVWYFISSFFFQVYSLTTILGFFVSGFWAAAFFWAINILTDGKGMGMGDVKLAFFMGLFLGYPEILMALFLSFLNGTLVGLALIVSGKKEFKSEVPFAPLLITGFFLVMFFGDYLMGLNFVRFL